MTATGTHGGMSEEAYLTAEQVAGLLQVSVKSVSRWAGADSSMPVLKIGRTVRFPRERLLRWLRAREQGPGKGKQPRELLPSHSKHVESIKESAEAL